MKKLLVLYVILSTLVITTKAAGPPLLGVLFNPTNNNLIYPTNAHFFNASITNPLLVTNLTSFILWAAGTLGGNSTNSQVVSASSLSMAVDGITDDTTTFTTAIGIANALGKTIDLQGRTSLVSQLNITVPIQIQNGIIKQFSSQQTNVNGIINVTGSNVTFKRINIDGDNKTLRGIRLQPGAYNFNFESGGGYNFLQPTNHGAQTAFFIADWDTSFHFHNGWIVSNIVGVANGVIGDDAGTARAFLVVKNTGVTPPKGTVENGFIYDIKTIGVSPREDSEGISVHRGAEGEIVAITWDDILFKNNTKRGAKIMADGYTIKNFKFDLSDITDTNFPMHAAVSLYAGKGTISDILVPAGLFGYGIEVINNNSVPLSDIGIYQNNIGMGLSTNIYTSMIGIKVGGLEGFHNVRLIGNNITNAHMGIQIAGNVTNYAIIGNIISNPFEEGVMDGQRYSADLDYTNNWNGIYIGNAITGTPTGGGIRFRRTKDVILGQNFMPNSYGYTFDTGYGDIVKQGPGIYQNNIYGGTLTNLTAIHIGTNSTTLFSEIPDLQIDTATGTNTIILSRFRDGTYNRLLAIQVNTNGVYFTASQTAGGNGNIFFQNGGGITVGQFNSSGQFIVPSGVKATNLMNWSQTLTNYYVVAITDQTNVVQLPLFSSGAGDTNLVTLGKLTTFGLATVSGINIGTISPNDISIGNNGTISGGYGSFGNLTVQTQIFNSTARMENFPTGLGLTNLAGIVSNNIVAGSAITITAGSSGQLTIASTGGGGGGGNVFNDNLPTIAGQLAVWLDTTKTNIAATTNVLLYNGPLGTTLAIADALQTTFLYATNYGEIISYSDLRLRNGAAGNGIPGIIIAGRKTESVTGDRTLTSEYSNFVFDNTGASAKVTFYLPSGKTNCVFTFNVTDADGIDIVATNNAVICRGSTVSAANGVITGTTIGSSITIIQQNATEWITIAMTGDFIVNTVNSGVITLTDAATIATDASLGNSFKVTLGGNRTLGNPTNPKDGQNGTWIFIQDGTGSRTITLDTKFGYGTDITNPLVLTTAINKRDFMTAKYDLAADKWYVVGFVRGY